MQKPILTACTFTVLSLAAYQTDEIEKALKLKQEVYCMAKNIYHEAGTESFEGKSAVSQVVMNRLNDPKYPKNVCAVVYQNNGRTYQFSWVGMKPKKVINTFAWEESMYVAQKALSGEVVHPGLQKKNALFYHANYVHPKWKLRKVATIGNHIFYTYKT
jgi:spore germination cell wall hydrolase CwlJ-like protein